MNYRLDSDYPRTYFGPKLVKAIQKPYVSLRTRQEGARFKPTARVLWVASNCKAKNNRHNYVQELMKHIPVDSIGGCMRNAPWPNEDLSIVDVMHQYQFYLALENSNCKDYVSEKLLNVFQAGIVPIVDGPADYSPFIPHAQSVIRLDDFASPKDLAAYLKKLIADENLLQERHMEYRQHHDRIALDFMARWNNPHDSSTPAGGTCRLCRSTHERTLLRRIRDQLPLTHPVRVFAETELRSRLKTTALLPDWTCRLNKWDNNNIMAVN
jgi:hypothetical protein